MKYKIGDKVIIGKENHSELWFSPMKRLEGTETTIESLATSRIYFTSCGFYLRDEDIEGLA